MVEYTPTTIAEIQNSISSGMQQLEHKIGHVRFAGDVTITKVQHWGVVFDASCGGEKLKCVWFQRNVDLKDHTVYVISGKAQYTPYGMQIRVHSTEEDTVQVSHTEQLTRLCQERGWFEHKTRVDFRAYKRLGILSKKGSKGYEDFIAQLRIPCESVLVEIALEGPKTELDIIHGIAELTRQRADCILIIRGGGDFLDMSHSYDKAPIFQSIVDCKLPVISAIGHSNDDLLINRVCDFHTETPTTLACFIRGQWREVMRQAYQEQMQHVLHHLSASYGTARRRMVELLQRQLHAKREEFDVAKRSAMAALCPEPICDMPDVAYESDDAPRTIVVRLAGGAYHRACLRITSDRLDTADVDAIHQATIDGAARPQHAHLGAIQESHRALHARYVHWCDRPFGDATPVHAHSEPDRDDEDDEPSLVASQIARLEHYKRGLDHPHTQPCTLDVLRSIHETREANADDVPEMLSTLRQLRYLLLTYGDAPGDQAGDGRG